jgi:hypothetical protein
VKKPLLWGIAIIAAAPLAGGWLEPRLGIDSRLVTLGLLLASSAVLFGFIAVKRHKLRGRLSELPPSEQEVLRQLHPELRLAGGTRTSSHLSASTATWIGVVWINLPVIPWMVAPLALRQFLAGQQQADLIAALLLLFGFACAWAWWSVNVTLWRRWSSRHGIDGAELQLRGQNANILWPKGHFLERTELGQILEHFGRRTGST